MIEQNPARMMANILAIVKNKTVGQERGGFGGGFGGGLQLCGKLRDALDLKGKGGFSAAEVLAALEWSLSYLEDITERMSPRKAERYRSAFAQIRHRLDWEFRDPEDTTQEPTLNVDSLISEFEHLAIEIDEMVNFPQVSEEEVERWERTVTDLETEIRESGLDSGLRSMLLDVVSTLKSSIRDLRRFGSGACAERLKDALGRIVGTAAVSKDDAQAASLVKKAIVLFTAMTTYVEMAGKWKAIPELVKALDQRAK